MSDLSPYRYVPGSDAAFDAAVAANRQQPGQEVFAQKLGANSFSVAKCGGYLTGLTLARTAIIPSVSVGERPGLLMPVGDAAGPENTDSFLSWTDWEEPPTHRLLGSPIGVAFNAQVPDGHPAVQRFVELNVNSDPNIPVLVVNTRINPRGDETLATSFGERFFIDDSVVSGTQIEVYGFSPSLDPAMRRRLDAGERVFVPQAQYFAVDLGGVCVSSYYWDRDNEAVRTMPPRGVALQRHDGVLEVTPTYGFSPDGANDKLVALPGAKVSMRTILSRGLPPHWLSSGSQL